MLIRLASKFLAIAVALAIAVLVAYQAASWLGGVAEGKLPVSQHLGWWTIVWVGGLVGLFACGAASLMNAMDLLDDVDDVLSRPSAGEFGGLGFKILAIGVLGGIAVVALLFLPGI